MDKHQTAFTAWEEELLRAPAAAKPPAIAGFTVGDAVTVTCPGHRHDGRTGTVSYLDTLFMGTVGVSIDGQDYGFFPAELTATARSKPESQP